MFISGIINLGHSLGMQSVFFQFHEKNSIKVFDEASFPPRH